MSRTFHAGRFPRSLAATVVLSVAISLSACAPTAAEGPQTRFVLGTLCTVNLFDKGTDAAYRRIFDRFQEIEDRMSANKGGTDVAAINAAAGVEPVVVHSDVIAVLSEALVFARESGGALDPTIGPLVKLWGIGTDDARVPSQAEIDAALPLVGWRDVVVDTKDSTVFLKRKGMQIDLGAIAKGYAADEAARIIKGYGIPRAIIDLGGNVLAYGEKEGGKPWRVGIQDPSGERGSYVAVISMKNKTMVTSGVYERFLEVDGVRYHHILDTSTGYPVDNGVLSVTIVADRSIDADGLSTTAFALGVEKGLAFIEAQSGIEAVYITDDKKFHATPGLLPYFEIADSSYSMGE